jgi:hypothetical protein
MVGRTARTARGQRRSVVPGVGRLGGAHDRAVHAVRHGAGELDLRVDEPGRKQAGEVLGPRPGAGDAAAAVAARQPKMIPRAVAALRSRVSGDR